MYPDRRNFRLREKIWVEKRAVKNMQYNLYLWPNHLNSHFLKEMEIGVEEHDGDVRFKSGSGNMAVSCMRSASGHNCRQYFDVKQYTLWSDRVRRFEKKFAECDNIFCKILVLIR